MAERRVNVRAHKTTRAKVQLDHWADHPSKGWFSGENHIHANYGYGEWYNTASEMKQVIEAEDLNAANFVVANSDGDGVFDREFFLGGPDPLCGPKSILYWNQEFRATLWGHMTLLNLKQLVEPIFTGFADTTNPYDTPTNADIADHTHLQGGHVNYTHPAVNVNDPYFNAYSAKALPVDAALGRIDSMDINWEYEPTLSLWYRLLNCGFRMPASAGTDSFLNRISGRLPGADRVYVKIDGAFSYEGWIRGIKLGHSFVTNGPLLEFESGREIRLAAPGTAPIEAKVTSPVPTDRFELVYNGEVVARGVISKDRLSGLLTKQVTIDKSGWLGVRAYAGSLQAHSSPIYVEVGGRPAGSKVDAKYFLDWIDRLEGQLKARDRIPGFASKANPHSNLAAHVAAQLNAGREVYRTIIHNAE
jgi:TolB protein